MSYPEFEPRKEPRTPQQLKQDAWRLVDLFPPPSVPTQPEAREIEERGLEAFFPRARLHSILSLEIQEALASILENRLTSNGRKRIRWDFEKNYLYGLNQSEVAKDDYGGFPVPYFGRRNDDSNLGVLDPARAVGIDRKFFQEEEQQIIGRVLHNPMPPEKLEELLERAGRKDMQAMLTLAFSDYGAIMDLKKEFITIHHTAP